MTVADLFSSSVVSRVWHLLRSVARCCGRLWSKPIKEIGCVYCHQSGREVHGDKVTPCRVCAGRGRIRTDRADQPMCRFCQGTGRDADNGPCPICDGIGRERMD
jgi:DnaJ-class molecular chaperone